MSTVRSPLGWSVAALLLAGCSPGPADHDGGVEQDGRSAYLTHCAACHQPSGLGVQGAFPPLAEADWLREQPPERVIELVLRGLSGPITVNGVEYNAMMPPFAHLPDQTIASILNYVYASWGNPPREFSAAAVRAVREGRTVDVSQIKADEAAGALESGN